MEEYFKSINKLKLELQDLIKNGKDIKSRYNTGLESFYDLSEEISLLKKDEAALREKLSETVQRKVFNCIAPYLAIIIYITIALMFFKEMSFSSIILNVLLESLVLGAAMAFTFNVFNKKLKQIFIRKDNDISKINNDIENIKKRKIEIKHELNKVKDILLLLGKEYISNHNKIILVKNKIKMYEVYFNMKGSFNKNKTNRQSGDEKKQNGKILRLVKSDKGNSSFNDDDL